MLKAAVAILRSLAAFLILLNLAACETGSQQQIGEHQQSEWYEGFTHSDGRTFRPLTEHRGVWEVVTRPDPAAGLPGKRRIFLMGTRDSLRSKDFMSSPCPCCPDYHHGRSAPHDSLNPPCCVECLSTELLWINGQKTGDEVKDTVSLLGSQSTTFGAPGTIIVEALCEINGVSADDTVLGVQLDIAMMGQELPSSENKEVGGHVLLLPRRSGAGENRLVLLRRSFRVAPGPATIALTGRDLHSGRTVNFHWRATRANVYYDLQ